MIWRCNRKYKVKGKKSCDNKHIDDRVLNRVFVEAFNAMVENKDYFMEKWKNEDEDVLKKYKSGQFIEILENTELMEKFNMDLFFKIVEKMTMFDGEKIIVMLLDGTEVECEM